MRKFGKFREYLLGLRMIERCFTANEGIGEEKGKGYVSCLGVIVHVRFCQEGIG